MSKVLVVYGTKTGCTTGIAEQIGTTLAEKGSTVDVVPADKAPEVGGYDAVVVGSGVRVGAWHEPASSWVAKNADALKKRPVALFTCGLMIREDGKHDEVAAYTNKLLDETGIEPVGVGLFAGWNEPKQFPFVERAILKVMKAPSGDFRDFDAVDAWATEVAGKLGVE